LNIGKERFLKLKNIYFFHPTEEKYYPVKSFIPKFQAEEFFKNKNNFDYLKLKFYPTSIKSKNKIVNFNEFNKDIFLKSILSRISLISRNYGKIEGKLFIDKEKFDIISQNFKPSPMKRWSNRKKRHMVIPSFEGELEIKGELEEIYPFLKIIENVNLGKSVSFGLGRLKITDF
jgi:hypothetical protein